MKYSFLILWSADQGGIAMGVCLLVPNIPWRPPAWLLPVGRGGARRDDLESGGRAIEGGKGPHICVRAEATFL